jgi:pimeloyl-ACP methyl ester carboxylesterase
MFFNTLDQSKRAKLKLILYRLMFVAGLVIAVGAYLKDENYGQTAQLVTTIGLIITLCASILLFPSLKRVILSFFILISIFSVLLFIFTDVVVYDLPKHLTGLNTFSDANPEMEIYLDQFGKGIEIESDGLTLVVTIYGIENETVRPGVVLIHGSTPVGRKLPLYRIISKKLVENGYIVLTYDARGFGESDEPKEIDVAESWNYASDAINAVSYLCSFKNVNKSRIYVIGHSFGAQAAMSAGIADERIKKIVAIGPSRRVASRILDKNAPDLQYFWERFSRDRKLGKLVNLTVFLEIVSRSDDMYNDYFYDGHVPILLIDGELESEEDKLFLIDIFKNMTAPKRYITLNDTGHYCNTTSIGNFMVYNDRINTELVNVIDNWFSE